MRLLTLLMALLAPAALQAADSISLQSAVFVEKLLVEPSGRNRVVLEEPKLVTPGDRLVFILSYRNGGTAPSHNFVVTNPLPTAVAYQGSPDGQAVVSIDSGRSWGSLAQLKIKDLGGRWRSARPEDVTHVRWALAGAIPVGASGKLSFRGVVR